MKEKFMIVQNFKEASNWDSIGTHKTSCWEILKTGYDSAATAVRDKSLLYENPNYCVVIKYYE